jgi:hypothetical protein
MPERKRTLGRERLRWTMDLGEVGWGDIDTDGLAQVRDE